MANPLQPLLIAVCMWQIPAATAHRCMHAATPLQPSSPLCLWQGMDVVQAIESVQTVAGDKPSVPVVVSTIEIIES